jgi:hypothetical protein
MAEMEGDFWHRHHVHTASTTTKQDTGGSSPEG